MVGNAGKLKIIKESVGYGNIRIWYWPFDKKMLLIHLSKQKLLLQKLKFPDLCMNSYVEGTHKKGLSEVLLM